ncbi:CDP-diacylglycerol--glycerol-3-phosphate 3-phosphatidyltransferase [Fusibacter sp. 3D3]|uniref:CDP-diacylglycerol--glycerol-3-phosphate 3-phosphatidyltransferase n=1 Tax=Fusibacter sp. 3D3 TaxID=1048380 RepID=UPI0008537088|nr:CDP-diacylglycerol--glycerol-3-phosphate 3-phosphatidyltransferase [Fusibacter sp. 3D3]GAU79097.1 CDP-diacylglycerol-glycerol-3-phosphate 3-phosphatidyltransferase [Fusibacter sp. 3D3]
MNIANKLTLLRVLLIPIFIYFLLNQMMLFALIIFVVASFTDFLDGYLARKLNLITNFGKFMDPLADKLLITSALICFVELGKISSWVVIVIISREFIVSIFRAVAASEGIVIAASWWGKFKTISQMIMVIVILMHNFPFSMLSFPMDTILIWIATILTIISGYDYIVKNKQILK